MAAKIEQVTPEFFFHLFRELSDAPRSLSYMYVYVPHLCSVSLTLYLC
jgi:hypothetical protein